MDLDNRKNEAKSDLKQIDMQIEVRFNDFHISFLFDNVCGREQEVLSRSLIEIGELKTQVEESRWEKMKAAVGQSDAFSPFATSVLIVGHDYRCTRSIIVHDHSLDGALCGATQGRQEALEGVTRSCSRRHTVGRNSSALGGDFGERSREPRGLECVEAYLGAGSSADEHISGIMQGRTWTL